MADQSNATYIQEFLQQMEELYKQGLLTDYGSPEAMWAGLALCERNQEMAGTWSSTKRSVIENYLINLFPDFKNT